MAILFVPKEIAPGERRVAAVPDSVKRFVKDGHTVRVQAGAGALAFVTDEAYVAAGASIEPSAEAGWGAADVVLQIGVPTPAQVRLLKPRASVVSFLWAQENPDVVRAFVEREASAFSMDALPRTTRAQKDDALTSQASLAGYRAAVLAAAHLPKIFPMQMTPAGTLRPAKVVILGVGVAGLQAIATAKRLGAIVEANDVRPECREQVESLGATWIDTGTVASVAQGYAAEQSEEFRRKQQEILRERIVAADVVITTALIPYRPAPKLVTDAMLAAMRHGSVIVDLAAERGGNVEGTEPGRTVVLHGVTVIGESNAAGAIPTHASEQYAKNVGNVLADATKKGVFGWDLADEIVAGALVVHAGDVRHAKTREVLGLPPLPPPAAPAPAPAPAAAAAPPR